MRATARFVPLALLLGLVLPPAAARAQGAQAGPACAGTLAVTNPGCHTVLPPQLAGPYAARIAPLAATVLSVNSMLADLGIYSRSLLSLFSDHLNVRMFGAQCDGVTDDTAAFQAAALAATGHADTVGGMLASVVTALSARIAGNAAIEIDVPAGRCILTQPWTVSYAPNSAIRIHGDGSSHTELQFEHGIDGLVVTFSPNPSGSGNDASRQGAWPGQGLELDGIHFVSDTGIVRAPAPGSTNIGTGAGERGTAVRVIGTPLIDASTPPFQRYEDLLFTNSGGWNDGANNWAGGLYLQDPDNANIEHVMFVDNALDSNRTSVPVWVHSTATAFTTSGHGNISLANVTVSGGLVGVRIDGDAIQGVNVSHLFTVGVGTGLSWVAGQNTLAGSLEIDHSSMGASQSMVALQNVSTVFSDHNFYYNVAPLKGTGTDPVFFSSAGGDTVVMDGDQFYGPTAGYMGAGHTATAVFVQGLAYPGAPRDVAPSVVSNVTISHFDTGIVASGSPIHFRDVAVSSDAATCYRDSGTQPDPLDHPTFDGIQCGRLLNRADGIYGAGVADWIAAGRSLNGYTEIGIPGVTSPAGTVAGQPGGIDFHSVASSNGQFSGLNDYDVRLAASGGVSGQPGAGVLDVVAAFTRFSGPVLTPLVRYNGFAVPPVSASPCNIGESGDGVSGGVPFHYYCAAPNRWGRVALATANW